MDPKIERHIAGMTADQQEIILHVRDIFLKSSKKISEALKWGQLTFSYGKTNIAFIYSFSKLGYMNLGFMKATSLKDPKKLFEGTGKGMRHIKIYKLKDLPAAQVKKWIKESLSLSEPPKSPAPKKKQKSR